MAIRYLSTDDVVELYKVSMKLADASPAPLVRRGDLERAVHHPRVIGWYEHATLATQAVDLAIELALAHAFVDGNKRISTYAMRVFLLLNGVRIPNNGPFMAFTDAFVETIGTPPRDRSGKVAKLVEMVQRWVDASAPS